MAEAGGLNPLQHGFESHRGHCVISARCALARSRAAPRNPPQNGKRGSIAAAAAACQRVFRRTTQIRTRSQHFQSLEERVGAQRFSTLMSAPTEAPNQEDTYMLRSSNPILSKQDAFTPAAPQQYNQNPYGSRQPATPSTPAPRRRRCSRSKAG